MLRMTQCAARWRVLQAGRAAAVATMRICTSANQSQSSSAAISFIAASAAIATPVALCVNASEDSGEDGDVLCKVWHGT